jgi:hypothetical protein
MGGFAIGQSVLRREDPRLLQGCARFFDDLKLADQLYASIVRSPHAHAEITGIDTRTARSRCLTRGQVNAVRSAFKAGITPSRIAREFGISQSDVRKALASDETKR